MKDNPPDGSSESRVWHPREPAITNPSHWSVHPDSDWSFFYAALKNKTGLDLRQYKPDQLRRRIGKMVQSRAMPSLRAFWKQLDSDPRELQWFLDKLAINSTQLFRDPDKWAELSETVLPELVRRQRHLKCWSAGCSTGAEAYALAIILDSQFPGAHEIVGTDVDSTALAQANRAVFSAAEMQCVPHEIRSRYFEVFEEGWRASVRLRRYLSFKRHDLMSGTPGTAFDLIVCRNVASNLTDELRAQLHRRLFEALRPGGVLFVGLTEDVAEAPELGFVTGLAGFYHKPVGGAELPLAA